MVLFFDGSAHGMGSNTQSLGAHQRPRQGAVFSTVRNTSCPAYAARPTMRTSTLERPWLRRVWDASAHGVPAGARVDGYARVDAQALLPVLRNAKTELPGLGVVHDEDIVYYSAGEWSLYFKGAAHGLTKPTHDIEAYRCPLTEIPGEKRMTDRSLSRR